MTVARRRAAGFPQCQNPLGLADLSRPEGRRGRRDLHGGSPPRLHRQLGVESQFARFVKSRWASRWMKCVRCAQLSRAGPRWPRNTAHSACALSEFRAAAGADSGRRRRQLKPSMAGTAGNCRARLSAGEGMPPSFLHYEQVDRPLRLRPSVQSQYFGVVRTELPVLEHVPRFRGRADGRHGRPTMDLLWNSGCRRAGVYRGGSKCHRQVRPHITPSG